MIATISERENLSFWDKWQIRHGKIKSSWNEGIATETIQKETHRERRGEMKEEGTEALLEEIIAK